MKSAQVFNYLNHAEDYGLQAESVLDFGKVIKRSRGVADGMSKGVQFLMKKNKIEVIEGYGKLLTGKRVEVTQDENKQIISADHIIIATSPL